MKKYIVGIYAILFFLTIAGCAENAVEPGTGEGKIKLYLIDSPADYDEVNIFIKKVEVHIGENNNENSAWLVVNNHPQKFDLLKLRNGLNAVLGDTLLPAGQYTQIRLILDDGNYIVTNGVKQDLQIPSGLETGIKLIHAFNIEDGQTSELILDFNVFNSIHQTGNGKYMMNPAIRVVANHTAGSISGKVVPQNSNALIWTISDNDTISTLIDADGYFKLTALPQSDYNIHVSAPAKDTVLYNVSVDVAKNIDIGTIILNP